MTLHAGGRAYPGRTCNVSRGGACASVVTDLAVGTDVDLDLHLVFEDDLLSDALRLPARIVWSTSVDDGAQIGLAFRPLGPEQLRLLALFMRYLDEEAPRVKRALDERSVDDRFG